MPSPQLQRALRPPSPRGDPQTVRSSSPRSDEKLVAAVTSARWADGGRFEATSQALNADGRMWFPGVSLRLVLLRALLCNATIQTQWRCCFAVQLAASPFGLNHYSFRSQRGAPVITCLADTASPRPTAPTRSECLTRCNPQWSWHDRPLNSHASGPHPNSMMWAILIRAVRSVAFWSLSTRDEAWRIAANMRSCRSLVVS